MKIVIEIECNNASFYGEDGTHHPQPEVTSILHILANKYDSICEIENCKLRDENGNTVGSAKVTR